MGVTSTEADNTATLLRYLNDHLAGSVAALELVQHVIDHYPDTSLEKFLKQLHADISADQDVLRDLLRALDGKESPVRKAGAWLAEKLGRVKLNLGRHKTRGTGLLEALEGLELGISGKQLLWRGLATASVTLPKLKGPDYAGLEHRAIAQRERVEERRLEAARKAFGA